MKKFNMIDEKFICENCQMEVGKLVTSARDHCPFCLYSKHVDINPGDRSNACKGLLKPIEIEKFKQTYKIVYQCLKCKKVHKNIIAFDDDFEMILDIMKTNANK